MSFGFAIYNDANTLIVDEDHPIYIAPNCVVSQSYYTQFVGARYADDFGTYQDMQIGVDLTYTFTSPIISIPQPLLFISQSHPAYITDGYYTRGLFLWRDRIALHGTNTDNLWGGLESWASNIRFIPLGSPGYWTGMKVSLRSYERGTSWDKYPERTYAAVRSVMPDYRNKFLIVGGGGEDGGDFGIKVWDTSGRVVFNSNSNIVHVTSQDSRWEYFNRSGGGGTYLELWRSYCSAASASDWALVVPRKTVRRYNGELATVGMASVGGRPFKFVQGGRSGSPVHTPMMYVKTSQPVTYT